jgi:hypothetical protein
MIDWKKFLTWAIKRQPVQVQRDIVEAVLDGDLLVAFLKSSLVKTGKHIHKNPAKRDKKANNEGRE